MGRLAGAAAAAATMLALATASTAAATPPTIEVFEGPYEFSVPCGSFDNLVAGTEYHRVTTYYDAGGTPIRRTVNDRYMETDTNSVTGASLELKGSGHQEFDLITGRRTVSGQVFLVTQPGLGIVILDTGRVVFSMPGHPIFEAGPHEALHAGIDPLVCAALS
jgi:hypothetical protein